MQHRVIKVFLLLFGSLAYQGRVGDHLYVQLNALPCVTKVRDRLCYQALQIIVTCLSAVQ